MVFDMDIRSSAAGGVRKTARTPRRAEANATKVPLNTYKDFRRHRLLVGNDVCMADRQAVASRS
jgi:hypothetical protein